MDGEQLITNLAQILAGLQVPLSRVNLGAAQEPLLAVLDDVGLGWATVETLEGYLRERLQPCRAT
jgi:hypothetical protein